MTVGAADLPADRGRLEYQRSRQRVQYVGLSLGGAAARQIPHPAQGTAWAPVQMLLFSLVSQQSSRSYPEGALLSLGYELGMLHLGTLRTKMSMCIGDGAEH